MIDVIIDALLDSLKILPFLFLVYLVIELIENKTTNFFKSKKTKYGPVLGASFGIIPQCGFGVVATKLYTKRYITIGTLIAIYLATSDEAIPLLISNPFSINKVFPFLMIKFFYALTIGIILDLLIKPKIEEVINDDIDEQRCCCGHQIDHNHENKFKEFIFHPLIHSLKIFAYIFIVNLILGMVIYIIGLDTIRDFMSKGKYLQPLFTLLVGLIPNCASSVLITQLYISDTISFGAAMTGLFANAGIALAVLFKENKNQKENLFIISILIISSLVAGYLLILLT